MRAKSVLLHPVGVARACCCPLNVVAPKTSSQFGQILTFEQSLLFCFVPWKFLLSREVLRIQ